MKILPQLPVHKGFVHLTEGKVHYALAGEGPLVVLLHASPNSSKIVRPLQQLWGASLQTLAFDLPGYGLSDPIEDEVTTAKVADRLAAALDQLGVGRAAFYGRHTGAGVAVELSIRRPDLASFVLTDGFPLFGKSYSDEELADYFTIPSPQRDGSHLIWAYYRCREQYLFWPWNKPGLATRADRGAPDAAYLHRSAVEFLEAGENLPAIYASAFRYDGRGAFDRLKVPTCFGNRPGDSQHKTLPNYPAHLWVEELSRDTLAASVQERALLLAHCGSTTPLSPPKSELKPVTYLPTRAGQTFVVTKNLNYKSKPLLIIPPIPGSHVDAQNMLEAQNRPCATMDPFGFGESQTTEPLSFSLWANQIVDIAAQLGWSSYDLALLGSAGLLTVDLISLSPPGLEEIELYSPPVALAPVRQHLAESYPVSLTPTREGGQFLRLWHLLRDEQLFFPWFDTSYAAVRKSEPNLDVSWLHKRAIELLKQPESFEKSWELIWTFSSYEIFTALGGSKNITLYTAPTDLFSPLLPQAEAAFGIRARPHSFHF